MATLERLPQRGAIWGSRKQLRVPGTTPEDAEILSCPVDRAGLDTGPGRAGCKVGNRRGTPDPCFWLTGRRQGEKKKQTMKLNSFSLLCFIEESELQH